MSDGITDARRDSKEMVKQIQEKRELFDGSVDRICDQIKSLLKKRFQEKGYHFANSSHEVLGIMTEEYFELVEEVRRNSPVGIQMELSDIAVAALYGLMSMG